MNMIRKMNHITKIKNNVFYNNDGYCIQSEDDQSLSKLHIHNNIFDSNETVFDINSISHTYAMVGLSNNIFNNNTNIIIDNNKNFKLSLNCEKLLEPFQGSNNFQFTGNSNILVLKANQEILSI